MTDPKWEATLQRWNDEAIAAKAVKHARLAAIERGDGPVKTLPKRKAKPKKCRIDWVPDDWRCAMAIAQECGRTQMSVCNSLIQLLKRGRVERREISSRRYEWRKTQ
jgi:hypothetical protein